MTLKEVKDSLIQIKAVYVGSGFVETFNGEVERRNNTYANIHHPSGVFYKVPWKAVRRAVNLQLPLKVNNE